MGLLVVGFAVIAIASLLWLVPTSPTTSTVGEHSTTTVSGIAGRNGTTAVQRHTTTTAPRARRSDAVLVALVTLGGGLITLAVLWDRIQELTIGGVSVQLADAAVALPDIDVVEAEAVHADTLESTAAREISKKVQEIADKRHGFVRVDLREGGLWRPVNLRMFVVLLAHRTAAEVIVFSGRGAAGPSTYLGAASAKRLAKRLEAEDSVLLAARQATDNMPMGSDQAVAVGMKFFEVLKDRRPDLANSQERVDRVGLIRLADEELIEDSVESERKSILSTQQQHAILRFSLPYVPITDGCRLDSVADQRRLAQRVALAATAAG
jgi:hypothetical protein